MKRLLLLIASVFLLFQGAQAQIATFPYSEDFETGNGGWGIPAGAPPFNEWELGTPAPAPNVNEIDRPAVGGVRSWVTDLDGQYEVIPGSGEFYLVSPQYDFSAETPPGFVLLNVWYDLEVFISFGLTIDANDGAWLEYSIDGGNSWNTLGTSGTGLNWYNHADIATTTPTDPAWSGSFFNIGNGGNTESSQGWLKARHPLPNAVFGQPDVRFRIALWSDGAGGVGDGFAMDNFTLSTQDYQDIALTAVTSPNTGTNLGAETVTVELQNDGPLPITNPQVRFTLTGPTAGVSGSTVVTETISATMNPGDALTYTFTTPADMSFIGNYDFLVEAIVPGDIFPYDNQLELSASHTPIPAYSGCGVDEDFISASGSTPPAGWTNTTIVGTANDVWRFDNPNNRTLPSNMTDPIAIFDSDGYSGGGSGPEDVVLETPTFDATQLNNHVLEFEHWFRTGFGGGGLVEVSTDGGATWSVAASAGTAAGGVTLTTQGAAPGGTPAPSEALDLGPLISTSTTAKIRFRWQGDFSWYWLIDNVFMCGIDFIELTASCDTELARCIELNWTDSVPTTNNYVVQRATDLTNFGNWQLLLYTDTTYLQDCNTQPGETYYYRIQYLLRDGLSDYSNVDTVDISDCKGTAAGGLEPYEAVLSAEPGHQAAYLSWNAADPGHNVRGYEIYYSVGTDQGMVRAARIDETTTYTVLGLVNGFDYYFKIRPIYEDFTFGEYSNIEMVRPSIILDANEELTASDVRVFPNPNNGTFRLALDRMPQGAFTVEVLSMTGQKVFSQNVENAGNNFQLEVTLPEAASGLYLLNLHTEQGTIQKKVNILR